MPEQGFRYFRNDKCRYFPCHEGVDPENFNCLFCFCPLNPATNCGGNYRITQDGKKDCSKCVYPHKPDNYEHVIDKVERLLNARKFPQDGIRI